MSAEDLPPLDLSQRLHVNLEKYPNLLKHCQERNVKIKPEREEDSRLSNLKKKIVSIEAFQNFFNNKSQHTSDIPTLSQGSNILKPSIMDLVDEDNSEDEDTLEK